MSIYLCRDFLLHTSDCQIANLVIVIENISQLQLRELRSDHGSDLEAARFVQGARVFEWLTDQPREGRVLDLGLDPVDC